MILHSVPSESYKEEYAEKFAKNIASAVYKNNETHPMTFIIRPWLLNVFEGLRADKYFVDVDKKKI